MTGLAVTSLVLSHFRSYRTARMAPGPGPVVLMGPNGAGKTNLMEAVSLLSPGRGLRRAAAGEMSRRPDAPGWKITAEISCRGRVHEVETWSEGGAARQVRIDGKAAAQLALGRIVRAVWLVPSMDRLWVEAADGRRRFLDRMVLSFEPGHGDAVLRYEKAMRERNRLLKDQVRDPAWYEALEAHMAGSGAEIHSNRRAALVRIATAQGGATTAFPSAELSLAGPEGPDFPESEDELREALRSGRREDLVAGRTLAGPHRTDLLALYSDKGIEARQSSTGEQKALLLSLILSNARALAVEVGAPPLLLLDEVAAHLDSGRRRALYDEIAALGAQAWMTGTGAELFTDLGARACRYSVTEDALGSVLQPVPN